MPRLRLRRFRRAPIALLALLLAAGVLASCSEAPPGGVHVLTLDAEIGPVTANYLERGIDQAEEGGAVAVVVQLDTPGGLDSSMREMVQRINASTVPVVVYVAPQGSRAASAGTFITMAAHVAAMAPNTAIGAAHPVSASGGDIEDDLGTKVENDAAAYIRGIAETRGRNVEWAERAVRESVSATASEALDLGVIDLTAPDLDTLLAEIDGREVLVAGGAPRVIATEGTSVHENSMTPTERFLLFISSPNLAFLLLSIGSLALVLELLNPTGIGAAVGILALVVAFFALGTLPVNWAGVALVMLGGALMAAEIFIPGGIAGIAGVGVMILGGLFLTSSSHPSFEVSRWLAIGLPIVVGVTFGGLMFLLLAASRKVQQVGPYALVGVTGVAGTEVTDHDGTVLVRGQRWLARLDADARGRPVAPGESVVVTRFEGSELRVQPSDSTEGDESSEGT